MKKSIFFIYLILSVIPCTALADGLQSPSKARHAEDFALLDNSGKFQQLYYYSDMKAVVLVSQENNCPIMQKSYNALEELKKKYGPLGVVFLMINPNPQDDRDSINKEVRSYGVDIPILEDRAQIVTEGLGIKRTAEALVINPKDWSIAYQGPINEDAIKAVLANKPVLLPRVSIKRCLLNFNEKNDKPTYTKDIAPILINRCIACHSPGQIAPWSMDNYEKVKSHGAMIREVVRTRRMPPWEADYYYGKLANNRSLTPDQTRLLVHWIEQGMNRVIGADPLIKASQPKATDGYSLGKPDFILSLKDRQSIPATGLLDYRTVPGDKILDQDRWVRAIFWKPGNNKVLHHAFLLAQSLSSEHQDWFSDSAYKVSMVPSEKSSFSHTISALGMGYFQRRGVEILFPENSGIFLPKGTRFAFSLHYVVTGKPETDDTKIYFYFCKKKPEKILSILPYINERLNIPAHAKDFKVTGFLPIKDKVTLFSINLHMHLRGRAMRIIAHHPDGSSEIILSVPQYRFFWQTGYSFEKPIPIAAGTIMEIRAFFDNSAQNMDNPDPDKAVKQGRFTTDEMMVVYFNCVKETK